MNGHVRDMIITTDVITYAIKYSMSYNLPRCQRFREHDRHTPFRLTTNFSRIVPSWVQRYVRTHDGK